MRRCISRGYFLLPTSLPSFLSFLLLLLLSVASDARISMSTAKKLQNKLFRAGRESNFVFLIFSAPSSH